MTYYALILVAIISSFRLVAMTSFEMPEKFVCVDDTSIVLRGSYSAVKKQYRFWMSQKDHCYLLGDDSNFTLNENPKELRITAKTKWHSVVLVINKRTSTSDTLSGEIHEFDHTAGESSPVITNVECNEYH